METSEKCVFSYCYAFKEYSIRMSFVALYVHVYTLYMDINITAKTFSLLSLGSITCT